MNIWETEGKDENYDHYRMSERSIDLRKWVDDAYSKLAQFLDKDWVVCLRNKDFYARLIFTISILFLALADGGAKKLKWGHHDG